MQGWVPNLSAYKRGVVEHVDPDGHVTIRVTHAQQAGKVLPRFRHPSTGEWVHASAGAEEEEEEGDGRLVCAALELQEVRLIRRG